MRTLLSIEQDAKTVKGTDSGWLTGVLYLAPADEAGTGVNLCTSATAQCRAACLYTSGMASVFPTIKRTRIERTRFYVSDPAAFMAQLADEIRALVRQAQKRGLKPAVRVNGTSDLPKLAHAMAKMFPDVQFYDYTKHARPWQRTLPNYHVTFSFSGENMRQAKEALKRGINVAVVFSGGKPAEWYGCPVVDGDEDDLRFLDPQGVIVALKAKGDAKKLETGGFVQIGQ